MNFDKTKIEGCWITQRTPYVDERGYFARVYCEKEFSLHGLEARFVQSNLCMNKFAKTLRGLHIQLDNSAEDKIVTCTRGKLYDVCVDVRKESATYGQYIGMELTEENGLGLVIPKGCAHGYLTLEDNTQILYYVTAFFSPGKATGFRYDDPLFGIDWPMPEPFIISEQDKNWLYMQERNEKL